MPESLIFMAGKIFWAIFAPSHFIVILLILSAMFFRRGLRLFIKGIAALFFLVMLIFPAGDWALVPLEQCAANRGPPMNVNGVIILGGALDQKITVARKEAELNGAADRLFTLIKLRKLYPNVPFVYTGGSGQLIAADYREADEVKKLMEAAGLSTEGITFDGRSRNTFDDANFSRDYYGKMPGEEWLLVTSAWHMPRTLGLFEAAGKASQTRFSPYPTDYATPGRFRLDVGPDFVANLDKLDRAVKEYVGLGVNMLLKRTPEFWPCAVEEKKLS